MPDFHKIDQHIFMENYYGFCCLNSTNNELTMKHRNLYAKYFIL